MQLRPWTSRLARASAVAMVAIGLAACDPPPPRLQLTVDTTAAGPDADPGDGACATATGACTLLAALQEGDASATGADLVVPAGHYEGLEATLTGDVRVNPASPAAVTISDATFTVAPGGSLGLRQVNASTDIPTTDLLDLAVSGTAAVTGSVVETAVVAAGGSLGLVDSAVVASSTPAVTNAGTFLAVRSSVLAHDQDGSATEAVLHTEPGATTHLDASVIAQPRLDVEDGAWVLGGAGACTGATPVLAGASVVERPAPCGAAGTAASALVRHRTAVDTGATTGFELSISGSSRLVDAIPLGDPACDTSTVDLYGTPRGVDGDGDGVGGCDVGAIERPTPAITPLSVGGPGNMVGNPATGSWASIHGPGTNAENGDRVNTRCITLLNTNPCTSGPNPDYLPPSDPDAGSWYVIEAPAGGGPVTVSIFDAQFTVDTVTNSDGALQTSGGAIDTSFRIFQQTNPLDFHMRTALGPNSPNTSASSCHWSLAGQATFDDAWVPLCTFNTAPGDIYLLNVRSAERPGVAGSSAANGFAVRACTADDCSLADQPRVHAGHRMVHQATLEGTEHTFYLAEVGPEHAGSTLVVELWDAGDSGYTYMGPRMPSTTVPGPVEQVPASACELSSSYPGLPGRSHLSNMSCSILTSWQSSPNGPPERFYNGQSVTMRIEIPDTYTCTLGVDPVTTAGSCWWGIHYSIRDPSKDVTTLQARIED